MKSSWIAKALTGCLIVLSATASVAWADSIRMGMSPEPYMPFTQINQAGVWEGFEADLSHAVCHKMGRECKISQSAWEGLIPALTAGKIDFIVGAFSITDERRKVVDFSTPYFQAITVLVGMKSDNNAITDKKEGQGLVVDPTSMKGKLIGYQSGTVQAAYAEKYLSDIDAKAYPAADTALSDLTAGRVDYVLMDVQPVKTFLDSKDGSDYEIKHQVPSNPSLGDGIGYAVQKGDAATLGKLNAALADLKKDGTLDAMVQKWFFTAK